MPLSTNPNAESAGGNRSLPPVDGPPVRCLFGTRSRDRWVALTLAALIALGIGQRALVYYRMTAVGTEFFGERADGSVAELSPPEKFRAERWTFIRRDRFVRSHAAYAAKGAADLASKHADQSAAPWKVIRWKVLAGPSRGSRVEVTAGGVAVHPQSADGGTP